MVTRLARPRRKSNALLAGEVIWKVGLPDSDSLAFMDIAMDLALTGGYSWESGDMNPNAVHIGTTGNRDTVVPLACLR
jgi:hypothetical protein